MSYKNIKDLSAGTIKDLAGLDANNHFVKQDVNNFATASQGSKADSAVQPEALSNVAFSGSYDDLSSKPTIPAAQVNSDWNANSGVASILNKPTLGTAAAANTDAFATAAQGAKADTAVQPGSLSNVATSGSYNDLSSRPNLGPLATLNITSGTANSSTYVRGDGTWSKVNYTVPDNELYVVAVDDNTKKIQFDANNVAANTIAIVTVDRSVKFSKMVSAEYSQSFSTNEKNRALENLGIPIGAPGQKLRRKPDDSDYEWESGWETVGIYDVTNVAVLDITNLGSFKNLRASGFVRPATADVGTYLRVSTDNGASFAAGGSDYAYNQRRAVGAATTPSSLGGAAGNIPLYTNGSGNTSGTGTAFDISMHNFNIADWMFLTGNISEIPNSGTIYGVSLNAWHQSASVLNAIRFVCATGNIAYARIILEGVRG